MATKQVQTNTQSEWVELTPSQVAEILGWVPQPNKPILCHGYYQEQPITLPVNVPANATTIAGQEGDFHRDEPSTLRGDVVITQQNRQVTGNAAQSIPNPKTHQAEFLTINGDVHVRQPGAVARGDQAQINLLDNSAWIENVVFRYQPVGTTPEPVYDQQRRLTMLQVQGTNYRGTAKQFDQVRPKLINLTHVTITSCNPYSQAWDLSANKIILDQTDGIGTAYNTWIAIHGIPVFYTPYMRFPIDNRRKTGFLFPSLSSSSVSGWGFGVPFYWNMAPNYDMTVTPIYYTKRGTQYNDLFRYLTWESSGEMYFSALPGDKVFAANKNTWTQPGSSGPTAEQNKLAATSDNRYQFAWQDNTQYTPSWSSQVQFDYVHDDYYILDFGDAPMFNSTNPFLALLPNTQLSQMVSTTYATDHWSLTGLLQNYETLHPVTLGTQQDQYSRLPQITLTGTYPHSFLDLDYHLSTQFTDFQTPLWEFNYPTNVYPNPPSGVPAGTAVTGDRYDAAPSIDLPLTQVWGYLKPQITFEGTAYSLNVPNPLITQKGQVTRAIPIYDIDSGLYFDRDTTFGKEEFTQTLEPRLFYLNVPYVNQFGLPIFDTSLNPIATYDQLFSTNQFTGIDRIQNANQVTAGVTSRFIKSDTGYDVLDMSIGDIYYFTDRQVELATVPLVPPNPILNSNTEKFSPIVSQINWQFRHFWTATGNLAYNPISHFVQNSNVSLTYNADNNHIVSSSYGFVQNGDPFVSYTSPENNFQQFSLGMSWPLNYQWQFLAEENYNVSHGYFQTYFYGLEYHSCCWAIRLLNSKTYTGIEPNTTAPMYDNQVYLQFTLTGFSNIGNGSPTNLLQYGLPGYQDTFGQQSIFNSV